MENNLNGIKTPNKFRRVKKVFKKWSESFDLNCYKKIFDSKNNYLIKTIWLVVLLSSTCATFSLIGLSIVSYYEYKVVSEIKVIYERPAEFPTLTFCDNNPLTTREAKDFSETMANLTEEIPFLISDLFLLFHAFNHSFEDDKSKKLGFSLEKNLDFCQDLEDNSDCKYDLHWYWSFRYGNCWQFNSGFNYYNERQNIKKVRLNGRNYGLDIKFNLFNENNKKVNYEHGLIVFVHNSSFKPTLSNVIHIEPGRRYYMSIKRTFIQKYPQPYSDCIELDQFESPFYNLLIETNKVYRQVDCFDLCSQEQIIKECGCYNLEYLNLNKIVNMSSIKPCFNLNEFTCMKVNSYNFIKEDCVKLSCPLECNSVQYDVSYSTLIAPSLDSYNSLNDEDKKAWESRHKKNLSYEAYTSSIVWLNIFYPHLEYTKITEYPKVERYDLFTQIGGSLGMFVSFSIFTIFELIEICFLILHSLLFRSKQQKKKDKLGKF